MLPFGERYTVLTGNYGSGKTELALAIVRYLRKRKQGRVALVDLDIVNPYFRSAEKKTLLEAEGVEVFMPSFAMSTVDIPALPAQIQAVFEPGFSHVVIDVGGDDVGATALGRYAPFIAGVRGEMNVLYVVNACRPMSGTPEDIEAMFRLIERQARLRPDALVNNGNLQEQTTVQTVLESYNIVSEAARKIGVPLAFTSGTEALRAGLPEAIRECYFSFQPIMKPDWLADEP